MKPSLFRPYDVLICQLKYREDNLGRVVRAEVDGELFGEISYCAIGPTEAWIDWQAKIRRALACRSSTVILRTACQCQRQVNLKATHELQGYFVPLSHRDSLMLEIGASVTATMMTMRQFVWARRLVDEQTGFRILEEKHRDEELR